MEDIPPSLTAGTGCRASLMDEVHELLTGLCLFEGTAEVAGCGDGVLLLHASHLHAHVFSLNHHDYALWMQSLVDAVFYLLRHSLLHLQTMAEDVYHARYLAQSGDVSVGDIRHVHLSIERQPSAIQPVCNSSIFVMYPLGIYATCTFP